MQDKNDKVRVEIELTEKEEKALDKIVEMSGGAMDYGDIVMAAYELLKRSPDLQMEMEAEFANAKALGKKEN